jgi:hypothetical protein
MAFSYHQSVYNETFNTKGVVKVKNFLHVPNYVRIKFGINTTNRSLYELRLCLPLLEWSFRPDILTLIRDPSLCFSYIEQASTSEREGEIPSRCSMSPWNVQY